MEILKVMVQTIGGTGEAPVMFLNLCNPVIRVICDSDNISWKLEARSWLLQLDVEGAKPREVTAQGGAERNPVK